MFIIIEFYADKKTNKSTAVFDLSNARKLMKLQL